MVRWLKMDVRWLLLLLLVPMVAGQTALLAQAEVTTHLTPSDLEEFIPVVNANAPVLNCGADHFEMNDVDGWFKYKEADDGNGCAEARFRVTSPPGTERINVQFEADRTFRYAPAAGASDPSFVQNVRLYTTPDPPVLLETREYYSQTLPESHLQPFDLQFAPGTGQTYIVAWHFQETPDTTTLVPSPLTSVSYTVSVSDPAVTFGGIVLESSEAVGSIRAEGDTQYEETLLRVQVPESLFSFGDVGIKLLLPSNVQGQEVKLPSGSVLRDGLVVETVESGFALSLPASLLEGPGTYEFKLVRQTALTQTPLMWPLALIAMGLPLVAGLFAVRETRTFRANATTSSQSTAEALTKGNYAALVAIGLLLTWLLAFGRVRLLTVLPLQLEGTLYYVLLGAFAVGGFSIWFLTRYQLREIELDMERLHDLSQVKSQMIGTMSHELKTPLTPMKMELDMLESGFMGDLTPDQKESVSSLQASLNRLNHLVSDILDVSKSDSGKLKIIPAPMDLVACIKEVTTSSRFAAQDKGVKVRYNGPKSLKLEADQVRIAQVLTNLIDNAIKFTPKDGTVDITAVDEGAKVFFSVKDSGQGMPLSGLQNLFQPFGQIHEDAQTNRTGTGLGLYICKGIVEGHGGTIRAMSDGVGHGSTFEVRLPTSSRQ